MNQKRETCPNPFTDCSCRKGYCRALGRELGWVEMQSSKSETPARKRGAKQLPPGQKKVCGSIALTPAQWRKLDRLRGKTPRGTYIAETILNQTDHDHQPNSNRHP